MALSSDERALDLRRAEFGPGNVRLLSEQKLRELLASIAKFCPAPAAIGIGLAGLRDDSDRKRVADAIHAVWGAIPSVITHDLEIALAAAEQPATEPAVLVLSGTGSCCYGQHGAKRVKVGGWGHLLGDRGSGYAIAHAALRQVAQAFDRDGTWGPLARSILRDCALNEPGDLISWTQNAHKSEIAALARCVFQAARDPIAQKVLRAAGSELANDALKCAARLGSKQVRFVLAGSVLLKQPRFAKRIASLIRAGLPAARVVVLRKEGAWGAVMLAKKTVAQKATPKKSGRPFRAATATWYVPEFRPESSPTELRNPESMRFSKLSTRRMIEVMLGAEQKVVPALLRQKPRLVRVIDMAAATLRKGGRIFYAGAGTSGRLGVLDASECPPTFRASPESIQGIIAGGQRALWQAVEGAEDDAAAGASALQFRELQSRDLVIGIAASGRTPFVWGALGFAKQVGARTILLSFNPFLKIARAHRPDLVLAPNVGPEILTGSTRLKSGTATKLVLNMISTISMVRLGKVISNLMVDLNPSNIKLRDRAIRIVGELTGCQPEEARSALEKTGWVVKDAWAAIRKITLKAPR